MTLEEAEAAVKDMLAGNAFGDAGHRIVIEEFLDGEEASFIVMVDGEYVLPMATSQDHKRVGNGDTGPNTGGMGAYSPAPVVTDEVHQRTMERIIWPTVKGMAAEGNTYTGFLYAGLMIDKQGNPKVIEFNCRFGDPETQPIMLRMKSDLVELCLAACAGKLDGKTSEWDDRASLGVVVAPAAIRAATIRAMRSTACRSRKSQTVRSSTPAPNCLTTSAWSPTAGACCASPRWVTPWRRRSSAPTSC